MNTNTPFSSTLRAGLLALLGASTLGACAMAQAQPPMPMPMAMPSGGAWWSQHPGYLHAMSDLRTAYWLIQHRAPNDPVQSDEEGRAMSAIMAAYGDLQQASIADSKNINDQPPPDFAWAAQGGRLHQAEALLHKAHNDIGHEEDNPAARGLRDRALHDIDDAGRLTAAAIQRGNF